MKILIPIITFGKSGGHRVLSILANQLINLGHQVSFMCCFTDGEPYYPTDAKIINLSDELNVKISETSLYKKLKYLKKGIELFPVFDIIIANHSMTTFPVKLAKVVAKKVYYIQAYEPDFYRLNGFSLKALPLWLMAKISYKLGLYQIVNSPVYFDYHGIKAKEFIPPGINLDLFYPKELRNITKETVRIGCIGRTQKYKRTDLVIESFELIKKKLPLSSLNVAFGSSDLINEKKNISVSKPNCDSELADYYRSIDILIAPSFLQLGAYHYPVIEALACGTAVITAGYLPGNKYNSWILKNESIQEVVDKVYLIINDKNKVKTKINKGIYDVKDLSWDVVSSKLEALLQKLISN